MLYVVLFGAMIVYQKMKNSKTATAQKNTSFAVGKSVKNLSKNKNILTNQKKKLNRRRNNSFLKMKNKVIVVINRIDILYDQLFYLIYSKPKGKTKGSFSFKIFNIEHLQKYPKINIL